MSSDIKEIKKDRRVYDTKRHVRGVYGLGAEHVASLSVQKYPSVALLKVLSCFLIYGAIYVNVDGLICC